MSGQWTTLSPTGNQAIDGNSKSAHISPINTSAFINNNQSIISRNCLIAFKSAQHFRMLAPQIPSTHSTFFNANFLYIFIGKSLYTCLPSSVITLTFILYNRKRKVTKKKRHGPEKDVRETVISYDDEGGGEDDMTAFDITPLQIPISQSGNMPPDIASCKVPIICKHIKIHIHGHLYLVS